MNHDEFIELVREFPPNDPGITVDVPELPWNVGDDDLDELNRQSAYNEPFLDGVARCGCFHCGRIFDASQISLWLVEDDGPRSALCPFCGEDAVVTGTKTALLCTATLACLYGHWYWREAGQYDARNGFKRLPRFRTKAEFFKRGLSFYRGTGTDELKLGVVRLWPCDVDIPVDRAGTLQEMVWEVLRTTIDGAGETVRVRAYINAKGYYHFEATTEDGQRLPYEPWSGDEQELALRMTRRYGDRLRGLVSKGSERKMLLYVAKEAPPVA